jgi:hypothetical protein
LALTASKVFAGKPSIADAVVGHFQRLTT